MPRATKTAPLLLAAIVLLGSASAAALLGPHPPALPAFARAPHDAAASSTPDAADHGPHPADVARVARSADGTTPTLEDALTRLERRDRLVIRTDADWNPANGIRGGSGAPEDPYVIRGYHVDLLLVADTTRCYEIAENWIARILVLDWTGPCGLVHHNRIENLRTNRNVERTGDPTAVVITRNEILRVEELRHFDGALTENAIGRPPLVEEAPLLGDVSLPKSGVVLNIAGLNGADISKNTIHGGVDMKLHGHHHSDASGRHSHNHGSPDAPNGTAAHGGDHVEDHTVRHVNFLFQDNTIVDPGFGLRYNDLDHAGDDRTATSENEPALELPHVHVTTVRIVNNVIDGRGLRVSTFNAPDERHLHQAGRVVLAGNVIREPAAGSAVIVQDVRDATVVVSGNQVDRSGLRLDGGGAILLQRFQNATVAVEGNALPGYRLGVVAREFDARTTWRVSGNSAPDADHPVYWDSSVANPPEEASGEHPGHEGHEHERGGGARDGAAPPSATPRLRATVPADPPNPTEAALPRRT